MSIVVPQEIEAEKKLDKQNVVRVLFSVPNEGHTHVEAYADRLVHAMHLGKLEARGRTAAQFKEILKEKAPNKVEEIMKDFWMAHPGYIVKDKNTRFEVFFITLGRMLTPYAREEAAKLAIEHHMDYLYFVDDDMMIPEDLLERLYRWDVDVVAPLAFTRNFPHRPVIYSTIEGWDGVRGIPYFRNHFVTKYPKNRLVECDAVGFGAALIKVEVFKKLKSPYFMSTCGTGEDVYFCLQARKAGVRVYMDTSTKLGHLSHPQVITEEFVEDMQKNLSMDVDKKNGDYTKYSNGSIPQCVVGE